MKFGGILRRGSGFRDLLLILSFRGKSFQECGRVGNRIDVCTNQYRIQGSECKETGDCKSCSSLGTQYVCVMGEEGWVGVDV